MTDITELTSVQKNANIHRLSRLIAYAPNDELRQMAVEVEHYTDQLIEALEKAQGMEAYWKTQCRGITDHCEELQARIAELESRTVTAAAADVLAGRQRQVTAEGWTAERDDGYQNSELADAAACYAIHAHNQGFSTPAHWPWSQDWWKQTSPRRDLVKAGALILAEIERLDRAAGIKVEAE
ncbi:hypothetical protein ACU674_003771 [Klebsiella quasipneumoniae]|uniref:hypothetical protein n=1 Tax=Klebsiella quasipneumoniae TaxID=1463165 RepID=UPI001F078243|nr:hypothetical protein [Klebsiella quasipneumoniae]